MTELLLLSCPEIGPYITTNPSGARETSKRSVRVNWTVALVGVMELISTLSGIRGAKATEFNNIMKGKILQHACLYH